MACSEGVSGSITTEKFDLIVKSAENVGKPGHAAEWRTRRNSQDELFSAELRRRTELE
jgi:hypothetical protein